MICIMKNHHVTLTQPVSEMIDAQITSGRFKDFSAAIQEAAWNYFFTQNNPFQEYNVTPAQVEKRFQKDLAETKLLKKARKLGEWKP